MWTKGLSFKISFFLWRLWRYKLAIDDLWRRQGYIVMSICLKEETYDHIFLLSPTVSKVWKLFMGAAGITVPLIQVKRVIRTWWNAKCCPKLKPLYQAAPAIINWELWKKRNTERNGGTLSTNRVIHEVNKIMHFLEKVRYPWLSNIPMLWAEMIHFFKKYIPVLITTRVTWQLPTEGWYKCNTDRASKENPGPSSTGFCVRNDKVDLLYARSIELGVTTNVVAEAKAILQGLQYCLEQTLHPLILETDSMVLKKCIEGEWDIPWSIMEEVQKIVEIKAHFNVIFQYVFKEGNTVADSVANTTFYFGGTISFQSFDDLPNAGKTLINQDKAQLHNLRVRIARKRPTD
ncbi:uncharacterized protein LOC142171695 [Nicotiana tabacum]|uniref:Uncharacterized protein LOC142171695 n=1 Tax=Nicotiana tabacum TaxID=4097 RepID=A0AC58T2N5_TOBAC